VTRCRRWAGMTDRCPPTNAEVRRRLSRCPRCTVCGKPMTVGETDTHLSCRQPQHSLRRPNP
jgi:hypothetical protein